MDKDIFTAGLDYLATAYNHPVSPALAEIYRDQLAHLDAEPFRHAVRLIVAHDAWFPRVSRLLEVYRQEKRRLASLPPAIAELPAPPANRETARQALTEIRTLLRQKGIAEHLRCAS